jgi:hypothetical protein
MKIATGAGATEIRAPVNSEADVSRIVRSLRCDRRLFAIEPKREA